MTIGIDIDNTITNTSEKSCKITTKLYGCNDYHKLNIKDRIDFLNNYICNIVYTVNLKKDVISILNKWHKLGYKIIFITARGTEGIDEINQSKAIYLTSMYFKKKKIYFDEIIFLKSSKVDTVKKMDIDIFIDDKEDVLDEISKEGIKTIRFTNLESKHLKVDNWVDIDKIILEMGDNYGR